MAARTLRLATRTSLLAVAQTRLVARALEAADPALTCELVLLDTPGDRDRTTSLADVRDAHFFSRDLDEALLAGRVDACVHSLKDLPTERPPGIALAALPRREDPRDVVVFRRDALERLRAGEPLVIGTSTPRRHNACASFLANALPQFGAGPALEFRDIRGNVDQRLRQLAPQDDRNAARFDGVVLALAGLNRLCADADGARAVTPLLARCRLVVLPLGECPTAPGQGVLALECRADDPSTHARLAALHEPDSAAAFEAERGSDTGLGATSVRHAELGRIVWVRDASGSRISWHEPIASGIARRVRRFEGRAAQAAESLARLSAAERLDHSAPWFVTHRRALGDLDVGADTRLWAGGVSTWRALAARGHWVEGCAEVLGFEALAPTLASPALALPPLEAWIVLTSAEALPAWHGARPKRVLATYAHRDTPPPEPVRRAARAATHVYWTSAHEYRRLARDIAPDAAHACGPGRTLESLRRAGLPHVRPFPSVREWRAWLD